MRALRIISALLIIGGLLAACQVQPAPTPIPTVEPTEAATTAPNTPTPDATATSANVTPTAATTAIAKLYAPRPTATPYKAASSSEPNTFTNTELSVTLHYPDGWHTEPPEQAGQLLTYFVNAPGDTVALLVSDALPADQSLQSITADVSKSFTNGLQNIVTVEDNSSTLADGREAWTNVVTAERKDGSQLKVNLTTTSLGGRLFIIVAFAAPATFDANASDIQQLIGALQLKPPTLFGISRSDALILSGGESTNGREYDPATTHGSGDKLVFSGLVALDPKLNLISDLAGSWDVTDGVTYTFHLRPDARFHNGKPVTAQDVVYSWERAADPKTKSDTVLTYLGDIVGVKEMNSGKADHISGLKVIDAHTLQVTIDAPKPYFLLKLTYPVAFVVDMQNVAAGDEWWRTPNGTGPYRLARWDSFKLMLYERNDDYYLEPPKIPYVIVQLFSGVGLRLYESNEIDLTGISNRDVPRFLDPKEPLSADLRSGVGLCTGYVVFDVKQPPFDDPKVRQAFTLAFDRQKYLDVVLHGIGLPAEGLYPPGLPGYNVDLKGLPYDPERARQLLKESKYADNMPPIVYTDGGSGSDIGGDVAALAQMWQQTLGITLTVENIEPDKYSDELHAGRHGQLFSLGWCADYPDPENFADALFHTGAQQNLGNYSNPELDTILEQARVEQNVTKRMQLYQQAEQIIVDDAPVLFTTHSLSYVLVKPHIQGYVFTPIDIALERYLSIDPSKLK